MHRIDSAEVATLPLADQAQFQDFLAGSRYSIIIDGTVYKTGLAPQTFTFRSQDDAKQRIDLVPALVVAEGSTNVNATMLVSSADWFKSGSVLLDPTDPNNASVISNNLKASIRVFKDNNKDGSKDSN